MDLLIFGAGEYGRLVKEMAQEKYEKIDFLDDESENAIGKFDDYKKYVGRYEAILAFGNNEARLLWIDILESAGYVISTIVSPRAFVSPSSVIGPGCIVEPMAVINANAVVEKGSIVSAGAIINHNALIEAGCHIDCNAVVGANAVVSKKTHLNYGQVARAEIKK